MRSDPVQRQLGPAMPRRFDLGSRSRSMTDLEQVVAAVALCAMAAIYVFGTLCALLFVVASGGLLALRPATSAKELARFLPLLALPLLAVFSTIWSDAPARSIRSGLQLIMTVGGTVLICRRLTEYRTVLLLGICFLCMCLMALPDCVRSLATGKPLLGPFGSKNQMAIGAHVLFALGLAIVCDRKQPLLARLVAPGAAAYALFCIHLCQSAGAVVASAITIITFPAIVLYARTGLLPRLLIGSLAVGLLVVMLVFLPDVIAAWDDFQVNELKKDTTLTGRTYLWEFAERFSAQRPWLGHGYNAFWRQGNIDAEGLWRWGGIANRSGFNFHNAFIEMRVDLGLSGLILMVAVCAGIFIAAAVRQLSKPSIPMAFFLAMLVVLYFRAMGETGLVAPFNFMTMLWIAPAAYAVSSTMSSTASASLAASSRSSRSISIMRRGIESRATGSLSLRKDGGHKP